MKQAIYAKQCLLSLNKMGSTVIGYAAQTLCIINSKWIDLQKVTRIRLNVV